MGAVKAMLMDEEEKVWDKIADVVSESEDISEAQSKAIELFKKHDLRKTAYALLFKNSLSLQR